MNPTDVVRAAEERRGDLTLDTLLQAHEILGEIPDVDALTLRVARIPEGATRYVSVWGDRLPASTRRIANAPLQTEEYERRIRRRYWHRKPRIVLGYGQIRVSLLDSLKSGRGKRSATTWDLDACYGSNRDHDIDLERNVMLAALSLSFHEALEKTAVRENGIAKVFPPSHPAVSHLEYAKDYVDPFYPWKLRACEAHVLWPHDRTDIEMSAIVRTTDGYLYDLTRISF